MGVHQAPTKPSPLALSAHLHIHFYPPLLRSATVRKHFVGYDILSEISRDLTPEAAAAALCKVSIVHYLTRDSQTETAAVAGADPAHS